MTNDFAHTLIAYSPFIIIGVLIGIFLVSMYRRPSRRHKTLAVELAILIYGWFLTLVFVLPTFFPGDMVTGGLDGLLATGIAFLMLTAAIIQFSLTPRS